MGRETSRPQRNRKDGEMDDESFKAHEILLYMQYKTKIIPEADSFFPSLWLILLNIQVMPSDRSITSVELDF